MLLLPYFLLPMLMSTVLAGPAERRSLANSLIAADSQFHTQDAHGLYNYGYSNGESSKQESRSLDGVTKGSYSYMDSNGILQSVVYEADAKNGFRVSGTNIPVAPTTQEHPSEITPAFTSLLQAPITGENIPILNARDENQSGSSHNAKEMPEKSEETKTKEIKNEQDKNVIVKNTEGKFDALPAPPGDGFQGIYMYPLSQINPRFSPYQFNPSTYTHQRIPPEEEPERHDYEGYKHLGLLPVLQPNAYPFLGRNGASPHPMFNGLIPLFGMENSGYGNYPGYSYSSQNDLSHYGGYSNGRFGMSRANGLSRSFAFFDRNLRY